MSETSGGSGAVFLLISDLIFETKIQSTGQALGLEVEIHRSADELVAAARERDARLCVVDLNAFGHQVVELVSGLRALAAPPRVVGFVSHVDVDVADRAKQAGVDEVMPRSQFSARLPQVLSGAD